jgi:hypothetical protein
MRVTLVLERGGVIVNGEAVADEDSGEVLSEVEGRPLQSTAFNAQIESLFGFHSPQLAAFFSAAGHSFAKLFSKASKNTPLLAAG